MRTLWTLTTGLTLIGSAAQAAAQPVIRQVDLAQRLPGDADLIVIVDRSAQLHTTPVGRALAGMWSDVSDLAPTQAAWRELAEALAMDDDEAFDALLGRRVVLVVEHANADQPTRWALLTVIDPATQRRLQTQLRPTPRRTVRSVVVQTIEDGRFDLALVRSARTVIGGRPGGALLLAPADSRALFDRLIALLTDGAADQPLGELDSSSMLGRLPRGDALVIVNTTAADQPVLIGLAASAAGSSINAQLVASPGLDRALFGPHEPPTPAARPALESLGDRVAAAVWGLMPNAQPAQAWTSLGLEAALTRDSRIRAQLDSNSVVVVTIEPDASDRQASPIALTQGLHTGRLDELAPLGDAALASLLAPPTFPGQAKALTTGPDFQGLYPASIRSVTLDAGQSLPMPMAMGSSPRISWLYAPQRDHDRDGPTADAGPGWWLVDLSHQAPQRDDASGQARLTTLDRVLTRAAQGLDARRRLSVGIVRPALVHDLLVQREGPLVGPLAPLAAMRWVEAIRWDLWQDTRGGLRASLTITLRDQPDQDSD